MSYKHIAIGILGGIGPEATGNFYLKLISEIQKQKLVKSNTDYPRIIVNSIPAPELTSKIIQNQLADYIKGIRSLEKYGADFIVMACNTIHLYHDLLQKEIGIPILNLRDAVGIFLKNNKFKSVSVFGTHATVKSSLYKFNGINYVNPGKEDLEKLSLAIENFNKGYERKEQIYKVSTLAKKYIDNGTEIIVLGCTEISLLLADSKVPKIDTTDILVQATVKQMKTMEKQFKRPAIYP